MYGIVRECDLKRLNEWLSELILYFLPISLNVEILEENKVNINEKECKEKLEKNRDSLDDQYSQLLTNITIKVRDIYSKMNEKNFKNKEEITIGWNKMSDFINELHDQSIKDRLSGYLDKKDFYGIKKYMLDILVHINGLKKTLKKIELIDEEG